MIHRTYGRLTRRDSYGRALDIEILLPLAIVSIAAHIKKITYKTIKPRCVFPVFAVQVDAAIDIFVLFSR